MFRKSFLKIANVLTLRSFTAKPGPIGTEITEILTKELAPVHLEVIDSSNGSESHFRVLIVSEKFNNLPLIKCHRLVTDLVKTKIDSGAVHAFSVETLTPNKWKPEKE
ncbi:bolA-like protein DDB_G0274169 [Episyrphus balteatus]|uniref:bolA-like protein DDB_G0274169 n=1 Tax=Episyrphus balteatus TaxID=286459 RepID=UPI002485A494|nr:bolA-like protein DDB_G0274169 [Episyrphus balteatus]